MRSRQTVARRILALSLACGAGVLLGGCDDSAEASRALDNAQASLVALHAGTTPPPAESVESINKQIRQTLAPALADDSVRGAAKLIEGQTHLGDAEASMYTAERLEVEAGAMIAEAQSLAGRLYAWRHARADAAGSFAPDESVSDIDGAISTAQGERSALINEREGIGARLTRLEDASEAARNEVRTLREREVSLRDGSISLDGEARLTAIRDAFDAQREADNVLARASDLEAQAAQLRPTIEELDRRIDGAEGLVELLRASRESLQERGARHARTAQVDREQANVAAGRLESLLDELHAFRTDELEPAYAAAAASFSKAQASLRSASSEGASGLWLATAQHGQASLALARSGSAERYADALEAFGQLDPRLPFAGELQTRAKDAQGAAAGFDSEARDAYQQAASGFTRGARGPHADRLRDLAARLELQASGDGSETGSDDAAGG